MYHLLHLLSLVSISSYLHITSMLTVNMNKTCKMVQYKPSELLLCSNTPLLFLFQITSLFSVGNYKWCSEFCFNLWGCCMGCLCCLFFFFYIRFFSTSENNAKAVVVPHPCKTSRSFETVQILEEDYSISVGKFLVLCRDMYTDGHETPHGAQVNGIVL